MWHGRPVRKDTIHVLGDALRAGRPFHFKSIQFLSFLDDFAGSTKFDFESIRTYNRQNMKRLKWLSVLLLVLYVAVGFVADVHLHAGKDQSSLHCQLCQVSNLSVTQTVALHASPGIVELGILTEFQKQFPVTYTVQTAFGRAPPLS